MKNANKIMSLNLASRFKPKPNKYSYIDSDPCLVSIFSIYNGMLEKKGLLIEEVVCEHLYDNTKMLCQSILQCGHFMVDLKRELCKCDFSPKSGSTIHLP
jgi:hypothetical protein